MLVDVKKLHAASDRLNKARKALTACNGAVRRDPTVVWVGKTIRAWKDYQKLRSNQVREKLGYAQLVEEEKQARKAWLKALGAK